LFLLKKFLPLFFMMGGICHPPILDGASHKNVRFGGIRISTASA
jgi:hypothetical protein